MESSTFGPVLDWNEIIKKEARGLGNADLGKVHEVNETFVITEKGVIIKKSSIFQNLFLMDIKVVYYFLK
jgi:hypothetical protein